MNTADLKTTLSMLEAMKEVELKQAAFYESCADVFPELDDFWQSLVDQEKKHAGYIDKLMQIISSEPDNFTLKRSFNIYTVNTVIQNIADNTGRLLNRQLSLGETLLIAREIEVTFIESSFFDIIRTIRPEYFALVKEVIGDTFSHRNLLEMKIAEIQKASDFSG